MSDRHELQLADIMANTVLNQPQKHILMALVAIERLDTDHKGIVPRLVSGTGMTERDIKTNMLKAADICELVRVHVVSGFWWPESIPTEQSE